MDLIKKKARKESICKKCGKVIKSDEEYYGEDPKTTIFDGLHNKKMCVNCYGKENN
jgi:transcription initiation factor TFIIIB Brf1 subunit/transcription initiation factor TFIIB